MLIRPPEDDVFLKTGNLSLREFIKAGDELISTCKSWKWQYASKYDYENNYLPKDKQYLLLE